MDGNRFDTMTRGLSGETSRRGLLGGMVAGGLALLTGTNALAVKRKRRRGKNDSGSGDDAATVPGTQVGGIWEETIDVCHFDPDNGWEVMAVPVVTVSQNLDQGDMIYIDCCVDDECGALPCYTPTGCVQGACAYDVTEGAPCAMDDGTTGYCSDRAVCVSAYAPAPVTTGEAETPAPEGDVAPTEEAVPASDIAPEDAPVAG